jgi:endonuclease YncB( thermonuclease family)
VTTFGPYKATVVEIHDGDTFDVDLVLVRSRARRHVADRDLGFNVHQVSGRGVVLERQSVRLFGCNAPELATDAGKAALAYLQTVLHVGDEVTLISHGWDKYGGRIDGSVTLSDGRDLAAVMIAADQAAPWDGKGTKPVPQENQA